MPKTIFLDGNIYDELSHDAETRAALTAARKSRRAIYSDRPVHAYIGDRSG